MTTLQVSLNSLSAAKLCSVVSVVTSLLVVATVLVGVVHASDDDNINNNVPQESYKRSFTNPLANETFSVVQECVDTNGARTVLEVTAPPNARVPFHHHESYDEFIDVLQGTFYTTIGSVTRAYQTGESFVFPKTVAHQWWTQQDDDDPDTTTRIRVTLEPCFDGFHQSVEIFANLPTDAVDWKRTQMPKNPWVTATLYNIGGSVMHGPWYQRVVLWIFRKMACTNKGKRYHEELRAKYVGGSAASSQTMTTTTTTTTTNEPQGSVDPSPHAPSAEL